MMFVDAHCHLEPKDYADPAEVIARAREAGVVCAVIVGQFHRPGDFGHALEVAQRHPDFLVATMGVHPHDAAKATEADWAQLESLCAREEVKAVGEAGLDYYYNHSPRDVQQASLHRQAELAKRLHKPLVVHVRDSSTSPTAGAHVECHRILREHGLTRGVIHCFTGDTEDARRYLDLGFFISISGVVTYKKTEALQEAVKFIPIDRLMVETDSPYLTPVPFRGQRNEPCRVVETARKVAELKSLPLEVVAQRTSANAASLFGFSLPTPP